MHDHSRLGDGAPGREGERAVSRRPGAVRSMRRAASSVALVVLVAPARVHPTPSGDAASLSRRKIPAIRLEAPPTIDGDLSDPAWETAARAEPFSDRATRSTAIDPTDVRIGYDDAAIYVAFHCRDARPEAIIARDIRRDSSLDGEDIAGVQFDPFRSRRGPDLSRFTTNALGTPSALLAGGRAGKLEWKGEWTCAAQRVADGWTAEMRLPWQILSFPAKAEPITMGINFFRRQERTKVFSQWSNQGLQNLDELAGDWEGVRVPEGTFRRSVALLPYVTTGAMLDGGPGTGFGFGRDRMLNLGLDARWALTPELTAIGALNPDFSSVEQAVAGIDFIRGERLVPDTRPFFLEGSDLFRVNVTAGRYWGNAFFSGRVPAFDVGSKLYGRLGPRDSLGLLATAGFDTRRYDLVGRWTHDVGPASLIGAYLVHRSLPGDLNTVSGLNASIRRGPWFWRADLSHAAGNDAGGLAVSNGLRWDQGPLSLHLAYTRVEPDFRAANGFVPFTDFHGPDASLYYYREWRRGPVHNLNLYWLVNDHRRTDGRFFRRLYELNFGLDTRSDWGIRWGWNGGRFLEERDNEFRVGVTRNLSDRYHRAGIDVHFGTRGSRPIQFVQLSLSRRILGAWDLAVSSSVLSHSGEHSQHVLTFSRELDRHRAAGGRLLVENGALHYFLTYRVSGGRGMELFVLIGDPLANGRRTRTQFLTKLVFPFTVK